MADNISSILRNRLMKKFYPQAKQSLQTSGVYEHLLTIFLR